MPCKWKRKKGGCHGTALQGKRGAGEKGEGQQNTLPQRRTYDGEREFARFPDSLFSPFNISHSAVSSTYLFSVFIFLAFSLIYLLSLSLHFFFFSSPAVHPFGRVWTKKLVQNGRTELILRARKAKGGPSSLELHGALAIMLAKRELLRQSSCKRLLNIRT